MILCVGSSSSDTGYAWHLMERFWAAIAAQYPGRVYVSFKNLRSIPQALAGAQCVELDYSDDSALLSFIRRHRIRHLYLTDQRYCSLKYARLRRAGVKSIVIHDHTPGDRTRPHGLKKLVRLPAARLKPFGADAYIAVSDFVRDRFRNVGLIPERRCFVARNGIDLSVAPDPVDIRVELGLPPNSLVVVSASRATKYKGIHHIIRAAALVPDAFFVHCGDGPDAPFFRSEIERLSLQDRFFLLGKRTDVPGILERCDIAVHASGGEVGTSLSIMEFMRAGLPAVIPDLESVRQASTDGRNALLYSSGDVDDLAAKINALARDKSLRVTLGQNAKADIAAYDVNDTVRSVVAVFQAIVR